MRKASANRKFLIFCDESESSLSPRIRLGKVGRRAAKIVDYAIFIGAKAHHGIRGAQAAGLAKEHALAFADYSGAARFLKPILGPGDVVLMKAGRNNQLPRLLFSLLGEVKCTIPVCIKQMVCDDCPEFRNPELVRLVNEQLTMETD